MLSPVRGRETGPMSPCISVCAIGVDGLCSGCLRDLNEIAGWARMSPAEQWRVVARLEERWAARRATQQQG